MALCALALQAGDPVPDVDVTVEQVPGKVLAFESPSGGFDRLAVSGPRGFIETLSPTQLPPDWSMSRDGRRAIFSGPAVQGPIRVRLSSQRERPKSVDWDVSYAGRVLASQLAGGVVYAVELPDDLEPGGALSATLTDLYGDLLIDVPRVPGTTILPPRPPHEPLPPPCLRSGTVYAQSEQLLCACGSFPTPASWAGILFDERRLAESGGGFGAIVSTSSSVVWFRPPAQAAVGRHVVSGSSELGFAPSCKFTTQFLAVSGQIDSERILRGDSTPMRLTIDGSPDPIALRIENLTPGIIDIEGGVDQTLESAGGSPNTLTRQVRGLTRGDFNVRWTLAAPACPCSGP